MNKTLEENLVDNLNIIKSQFVNMVFFEGVEKIEKIKNNLINGSDREKQIALNSIMGLGWARIWDTDSFIEPFDENSWYDFILTTIKKAKKYNKKIKRK